MNKTLTSAIFGLLLAVGATGGMAEEINPMLLKDGGEGYGALFSGEVRKQAGIPEDIAQYIWDMQGQLTTWRSDLHKIPEIGHQEVETHAYLMKALTDMGYKPRKLGPSTGIVVDVPGEDNTFTIGVRADIDALPITEAKDGRTYRSTKEGQMHACGHDVHTTIALGVAKAYADGKIKPPTNIRIIFQPAEEPGTGAKEMLDAGVLDGVDVIIGQHVFPALEWGTVELTSNVWSAYATVFKIEVAGKPSHAGAFVHEGNDAILTASYLVNQLQSIASRNIAAADAGVVSIGTIQGGNSANQIADKVVMTGTTRAESQEISDQIQQRMKEIVAGTAASMNTTISLEFPVNAPGTVNNRALYEVVRKSATQVLGENNVVVATKPMMGGEDFAWFSQKIPAFFYSLGVANAEKGITAGLHTPEFDIDERALVVGTALQLANVKAIAEYKKAGGKF
ncbi:amidohydrolase [Vibrio vulnificus]|nr:amidohydrolase [Vibrio vulnificus]